jgi:hypothetical protein
MIYDQLSFFSPALRRTARRVVRWGMMDTFLGAGGGAIFGGVFGGFGHLVHFNLSPILSIAGYFAVCGGVAGALIGMCGGIIDPPEASETASPLPTSAPPAAQQRESAREIGLRGKPQNRLASDLTTVARRKEVVASQSPSWN